MAAHLTGQEALAQREEKNSFRHSVGTNIQDLRLKCTLQVFKVQLFQYLVHKEISCFLSEIPKSLIEYLITCGLQRNTRSKQTLERIEDPTGISLKSALKRFQNGNVYHCALLQMSEGVGQCMREWDRRSMLMQRHLVLISAEGPGCVVTFSVWGCTVKGPNVSIRSCDTSAAVSHSFVRLPEGYAYIVYPASMPHS